VVDGRITHVSERPPYPLAPYGGYAPAPYGDGVGWPDPAPERAPSAMAQPFPLWLTLTAPLVMLLTLAVAYVAEVYLLGADWATGALAASLAAFALAVVTVIVLIARIVAGRRALGMVALSALLALALTAGGVAGISQLNPLRGAQGKQFEAARQWQPAINEYAQTGEVAPNAPDIARVYTEWGEALSNGGDYAGAVAKLETVTQTYTKSGAMTPRARADLYHTYVAWIRSGATAVPFEQALTFLAGYTSDPACDAACQTAITGASGQAHFLYGQQLLTDNQFKQAITEFELVQSRYATGDYAKPAHAAAAVAYLTLARQTLTQDCSSAVPLFETLAKNYGDTDQGKQAQAKVSAPVKVTGAITGAPGNPAPVVYLSLRINPSQFYGSDEYHTTLNASTGAYTFAAVAPGVYFPTAVQTTSTTVDYHWWAQGSNNYSIQVGPLCDVQASSLSWNS
jgi:tetratricopeptide (TPR) repeat protein